MAVNVLTTISISIFNVVNFTKQKCMYTHTHTHTHTYIYIYIYIYITDRQGYCLKGLSSIPVLLEKLVVP